MGAAVQEEDHWAAKARKDVGKSRDCSCAVVLLQVVRLGEEPEVINNNKDRLEAACEWEQEVVH